MSQFFFNLYARFLMISCGLFPFSAPSSCSTPSCVSYTPLFLHRYSAPVPQPVGGDDGIRTHDPLLAGQVLSQLSYTPIESDSKHYLGFVPSTCLSSLESFILWKILLFSVFVFKDPQKLNKEVTKTHSSWHISSP